MSHLTITPISKARKSNSRRDYNEQIERTNAKTQIWCWDDSYVNNSEVYGYFAFYFHGIKVVIHQITAIKDPKDRLPSWSDNVGQGDRKVLELTPPLLEFGWDEWLAMNGPLKKQGTYRTLLSKYPLLREALVNCCR